MCVSVLVGCAAKQVSHHPPASAFYLDLPNSLFCFAGVAPPACIRVLLYQSEERVAVPRCDAAKEQIPWKLRRSLHLALTRSRSLPLSSPLPLSVFPSPLSLSYPSFVSSLLLFLSSPLRLILTCFHVPLGTLSVNEGAIRLTATGERNALASWETHTRVRAAGPVSGAVRAPWLRPLEMATQTD